MNLHHSFWYNTFILWVILTIYTVTDIVVWQIYQNANISVAFYDKLWFAEGLGMAVVAGLTMFSIALPVLVVLYNKMMVESLFYYLFQGQLPPYHLPWLSIGTSTNLYIISIGFIALSVVLICVELRWKRKLKSRLQNQDHFLRYLRKFAEDNGITEEYIIKAFDRAKHTEEGNK